MPRIRRLLPKIGPVLLVALGLPGVAFAAFTDVTAAAGLTHAQHASGASPLTTTFITGGGAAADYDGDGHVDLYLTRFDGPDLLYRNRGDGSFEDVAAAAGLTDSLPSNGALWFDIDEDGDLDLYVTTTSELLPTRNRLYVNDGDGGFTEEAVARGVAIETGLPHETFSATAGDYDGDGDLDLHVVEQRSPLGVCHSRLLENQGPSDLGTFVDVTESAGLDFCDVPGIPSSPGLPPWVAHVRGFATTFSDLDGDGLPDLAIAADWRTSRLYWNEGDGTFLDGTEAAGVGTDENGMGSAIGDFDGDGDLDWFVTAIYDPDDTLAASGWGVGVEGNRLYRNEGGRTFSDATDLAGVRDGGWGWGAEFFDYDNDGDLDLAMTNGQDFPLFPFEDAFNTDATRLWRNAGDGTMTEVAASEGVTDVQPGKGFLTFDYDADGDLDVLVIANGAPPVLYRNEDGNANDWLRVRAVGRLSNRQGVGARITVQATPGGPLQVRELRAGAFLAQGPTEAHFGLGPSAGNVHLVRVEFPALGVVRQFHAVAPNTVLVAAEPKPGCGLVGIEPLTLVPFVRRLRRRSRA